MWHKRRFMLNGFSSEWNVILFSAMHFFSLMHHHHHRVFATSIGKFYTHARSTWKWSNIFHTCKSPQNSLRSSISKSLYIHSCIIASGKLISGNGLKDEWMIGCRQACIDKYMCSEHLKHCVCCKSVSRGMQACMYGTVPNTICDTTKDLFSTAYLYNSEYRRRTNLFMLNDGR